MSKTLSLIIIAVHSGDDHVADDHVADDHDHDVEPVIIIPFLSIGGHALLFTIVTFLSIGGDAPAPRGEHPREARVRAVLPAVGGGRGGGGVVGGGVFFFFVFGPVFKAGFFASAVC